MSLRRGRPPYPGPVTPAEARVLELLRNGYSNPEIAVRLGLSVNTVRYHVSNLLSKAGTTTRGELRHWQPALEPSPAGRSRFHSMALTLSFAKWVGAAACVAGLAAAGVVAFSSFRLDDGAASQAAPAPSPTPTAAPLPAQGVVVGDISATTTGYQIVEAATQKVFELEPHSRLAANVGRRAAVFGLVDGTRIAIRKVEPLEDGRVVNCWGVVRRDGTAYALDGGACKGVELMPAGPVQMLSFVSEKVNLPVAACSVTRDARIDAAPLSLFSDPIRAAC